MIDLIAALEDRRERARTVKVTYSRVDVGSQCFVVTHPDDPERSYLVDLVTRTCNCPDFECTANPNGIDCKHILSVAEGELVFLPPRQQAQLEPVLRAVVQDPDPDDPFKD